MKAVGRPKLVSYDPRIAEVSLRDREGWTCLQSGADELGVRTLVALPPGVDHWAPGLEFVRLSGRQDRSGAIAVSSQHGFGRVVRESRFAATSISALLDEISLSQSDILFFPRACISLALGLGNAFEVYKGDLPRTVLLFEKHLADDARDLGLNPVAGRAILGYALVLLLNSRNSAGCRLFARTEDLAEEYVRLTERRFQGAPWPVSPRTLAVARPARGCPPAILVVVLELGDETVEFIHLLVSELKYDLSRRRISLALQLPPAMLKQDSVGRWSSRGLGEFRGIEVYPNNLALDERLRLLERTDLLVLPPQTGCRDSDYFEAAVEAGSAGLAILMPEETNLASHLFVSDGVTTYPSVNLKPALRAALEQLTGLKKAAHQARERFASSHAPQRFARFVCGVDAQTAAQAFVKGLSAFKLRVETERPVAVDSPDHVMPHGTSRDNSRNYQFNRKLFALFKRLRLSILDLGCSGGGFVKSCLDDGHIAVGIEGSDYSLKRKRAEWRNIPEFLFTADVTCPFTVTRGAPRSAKARIQRFDVVTSWELIEHIRSEALPAVCHNVLRHLAPNGLWIMSVSPQDEVIQGVRLHQTVKPRPWWIRKFRSLGFEHSAGLEEYFGEDWVRGPSQEALGSFHLVLYRPGESPPPPESRKKQERDSETLSGKRGEERK